jgi:SAM-dependent methyltransferase
MVSVVKMQSNANFPDMEFGNQFHSPGEEPWITGLIKGREVNRVLDLGCGFGLWGYLLRTYAAPQAYIVGLDISEKKISVLRNLNVYNSLIAGDVLTTQITGSFDVILVGGLLHSLPAPDAFLNRFEQQLTQKGLLIVVGPSNRQLRKILKARNYHLYEYFLRGLLLVDAESGKPKIMHKTKTFLFIGTFFRIIHRFLIARQNRVWVIAFKEAPAI